MEPRANHIMIGGITLLLIAAIALFGLWLARFGDERETLMIDVVFQEAVSGLSDGSRVEYNGLRVGSVSRLRLDPSDPTQVIARITVAADTPVTTDTQARIAMTNITGSSHIQLSTDSLSGPPLVARREGGVPVIIAEPSPFSRLRTNWEESMGGVNSLVDNINQMFSEENVGSITSILHNVEEVSRFAVEHQEQAGVAMDNLAQTTASANRAFESLDGLIVDANRMLDVHGEEAMRSVSDAMRRLDAVMASVDEIINDNRGSLEQGLQGVHALEPAIRDFRNAVNTIERTTRQFDGDPAGYMLGRERLPEFNP
ncbi:MCE family protein [Halomonas sp. ML-15]|uniref:MlaD family protein n=1 Tax=Halomonas sp. ML-15 TaxID=2773305 RepID=UPI00174675ED|nr:MlaD family protein [Halomonas sp. ML-15]MBD3898274.1 MCE family protein [Halomonas sp. ML-15]